MIMSYQKKEYYGNLDGEKAIAHMLEEVKLSK